MGDLSERDKLSLVEFIFKLQVDSEYLKRYMNSETRQAVVDEWTFENPAVRDSLLAGSHQSIQEFLGNPLTLPILGWIKSPAGN